MISLLPKDNHLTDKDRLTSQKNPSDFLSASNTMDSSSTSKQGSSHPTNPQQTQKSRSQSPTQNRPPPSNNQSSSSSSSSKWLPHEQRLRKAWRVIGTTVANCMSKADKVASGGHPKRDLDESAVLFLRTRREFHRLLSHTEAKLQGKAEEMESLETYVRTQPRIGTRKRKR